MYILLVILCSSCVYPRAGALSMPQSSKVRDHGRGKDGINWLESDASIATHALLRTSSTLGYDLAVTKGQQPPDSENDTYS